MDAARQVALNWAFLMDTLDMTFDELYPLFKVWCDGLPEDKMADIMATAAALSDEDTSEGLHTEAEIWGDLDDAPDGIRSYKMARQGEFVIHQPVKVHIYSLKLLDFDHQSICFSVKCSKGTYIRVLGIEIAKALNTVGYLKNLIRTSIGSHSLTGAKPISEIEKEWKHTLI